MSQFGLLDSLQTEIDAEGWPVAVRLLGVNAIGHEEDNDYACQGKDIPWLQETPDQPAWSLWDVAYRDVVILDGRNHPVGAAFNLTAHDLAEPAEFAALKARLRAAVDAE